MRLLVAIVFVVAACTDGLPTAAPPDPDELLGARGSGVTLEAGDTGAADLEGGRYRVAWVTDGCEVFQVAWVPTDGEATAIETAAASGETYVDLPPGGGSLDRVADCDYTVRFEAAD
jgi:hypothetical protein